MKPTDLDQRALSAARAARASVAPIEDGAVNPGPEQSWEAWSRRSRRRIRNRIAAVAGAALLVVGALVVTADIRGGERTKVSTAPAGQPSVRYKAFCQRAPKADDAKPESYVGSQQHVADLDALAAVAPTAVRGDVIRLRDYVKGSVEPTRPDSQLVENWPPDVRSSTERLKQFVTDNCGPANSSPAGGSPAGGDCTSAGGASICLSQDASTHITATGLEPGSPVVVVLAGRDVVQGTPIPLIAGADGRFPPPGAVSGIVIPAGAGQVTVTVTVTPRGGAPTTATFRR